MSEEANAEEMDRLLELLANPLTRAILIVLAGQDPGVRMTPHFDLENGEQHGSNNESG